MSRHTSESQPLQVIEIQPDVLISEDLANALTQEALLQEAPVEDVLATAIELYLYVQEQIREGNIPCIYNPETDVKTEIVQSEN